MLNKMGTPVNPFGDSTARGTLAVKEKGPVQVFTLSKATTEGIFVDIVEARIREHRPILVTTNHSGEAMEKLLSENVAAPLVRRLRDHCDCFAFEQGK